jgi:hypothetical protein
MLKTIYVGNLPFNVSEERVRDLFSREGTVYSVKLINTLNFNHTSTSSYKLCAKFELLGNFAIYCENGADRFEVS